MTPSKITTSHPSIPTLQQLRHLVGRHRRTLAHRPSKKYSVYFHFWTHILLIFVICPPDSYSAHIGPVRRSERVRTVRFSVRHGCPNRTQFRFGVRKKKRPNRTEPNRNNYSPVVGYPTKVCPVPNPQAARDLTFTLHCNIISLPHNHIRKILKSRIGRNNL